MKSFSFRKPALVISGLATIGVLLWVWYGQENVRQSSSRMSSTQATTSGGNAIGKNGSIVSVLPGLRPGTAQGGNGLWQSGSGDNGAGLFNENARSLMRSGNLAKTDYGLFRMRTECLSFLHGVNDAKSLRDYLPSAPIRELGGNLGVGPATEAMRLAGLQRSLEKCTKLYEGVRIREEEHAAIGALPTVVQYRTILRTLSTSSDFNNPETISALSKAVTEPLFGALSALLVNKVDYSELVDAYGREQAIPLYSLVVPLVLCRMGDDCGPGGLVTEQLCWINGICGNRVDDAIWSTLRGQGLDTRVMEQFVTRVHTALQNRDPSIFKKPK